MTNCVAILPRTGPNTSSTAVTVLLPACSVVPACTDMCAVYAGMEELQQVQAADEQRNVGSRISKALQSWQPAFSITQSPPGAAGTDEEAAAAEAVRQGVALQKVSLDVDSLSSVSSLSSVASADEL